MHKGYDYLESWREVMLQHLASMGCDGVVFWENGLLARIYDGVAEECGWRSALVELIGELPLDGDARILDIGAGTGTHVIPLARMVSHVTAVEPSRAMLSLLEQNLASKGISNVKCLNRRWEEVDLKSELEKPYDVVIASFSLDMPDLREAITRMRSVCRGHIFLVWNHGVPAWERIFEDLWPAVHGLEYAHLPGDDILIAALRQMGINPEVRVHDSTTAYRFSSFAEALDYFMAAIGTTDASVRRILTEFLKDILVNENGYFVFYDRGDFSIIFWPELGVD